jgi:hypothetical protein
MNINRIEQMKHNLANYRYDIVAQSFCNAKDEELTEYGLAIKYVFELLDMIDTPNEKS